MIKEIYITGVSGAVLVDQIQMNGAEWAKLVNAKNPETDELFINENNMIEIPLNDFDFDSKNCYGDVTFMADHINSALSQGAELLHVKEEIYIPSMKEIADRVAQYIKNECDTEFILNNSMIDFRVDNRQRAIKELKEEHK